jgi:mannose-1-phosphate guanylyltransferase
LVQGGEVGLGLLGAAPVVPSEKYGYIVPTEERVALGAANVEARRVARFVEKPKEAVAREMIGAGALWNCGVFALKVGYVLDVVRAAGLPVGYEALRGQYGALEKTSFDYAVVEKESRIAVIPYDGYWKDLGTWNTLTEEMAAPILGPGLIDAKSENVHIVNELDLPIAVLGLSNVVVAAGPDGILVSEKEASPRVKDFITFEDEPRYEERAWGTVHVLDRHQVADGTTIITQKIHVHKGATMASAGDERRIEVWTITRGAGELRVGSLVQQISQGSVLTIDAGADYELRVIEELELIAVIRDN